MKRTTLSFLTESKASHVSLSSFRRVAITLLVMLLTTASAWAQFPTPTIYRLYLNDNYQGGGIAMVDVPISEPTTTYTLTSADEPTREGYTFYGWSTSSTGNVKYKTGAPVELTGNLTLYAIWEDTPYVSELKYTITDEDKRQVMVTGYEECPKGTLNIPATTIINGTKYSVTSIGDYAIAYCSSLQSVTIPNSVTSIGNSAFFKCSSLQSVTINGNPNIGNYAFGESPATVTMNLTASKIDGDYWTTFYNDYNFQADEYTTVYKGTVNESSLMLTEVKDKIVNSLTAVILKSSGNPVMTLTKTRSSDTNGNDLRGRSDRTKRTSLISDFNANEIYTMGNTSAGFGFHRYTGEYFPAGKAFLPLNTSDGAKAQSLTIVFAIGATGIKSVSSDSNVQNDWFSLDGTRLSGKPSQPGIYVNGKKKVVIK